jgi:hypothetical protein
MRWIFFGALLLNVNLSSLEECPNILSREGQQRQYSERRAKVLKNWDRLLTWALSPQLKPYSFTLPPLKSSFETSSPAFAQFNENYSYFSPSYPIVGMVTPNPEDLKIVQCLFDAMHEEIKDKKERSFSDEEVLAKVISYRTLEEGMEFTLASGTTYRVDRVIDLWRGMPAFGLIPKKRGAPILLFRGTDLSITSEKSWASILSDLDIAGPGLATYERAKTQIGQWLQEAGKKHKKPRVIGFSLGGNFVLYSQVYFSELLNKKIPSVAFNPPGVSREIYGQWNEIPQDKRAALTTYVNQGDFISYLGYFLSDVWELSLQKSMKIIEAHTTLISTQPEYSMTKVDVAKENQARGY